MFHGPVWFFFGITLMADASPCPTVPVMTDLTGEPAGLSHY